MVAAERQSGLLRKPHQFKWFNADRLSMEDHCSQCAAGARPATDLRVQQPLEHATVTRQYDDVMRAPAVCSR